MIIAVIPEPSSPKFGRPSADSLQNRTQPAGAVRPPHSNKLLASGVPACTVPPGDTKRPRGGWLPIPSARGRRETKRDPAVSSIRGLGALPTTGLQAWLHGLG